MLKLSQLIIPQWPVNVQVKELHENSLVVQCLEFHVLTVECRGSIPAWETKIPQAMQCSQKKRKHHTPAILNKKLEMIKLSKAS